MRIIFDILDVITAILTYEWVRMPVAILFGYAIWRIVPKCWNKLLSFVQKYNEVLTAISSIIIYYGIGWSVRWYLCPLNLPLFCDCCEPANLLATFLNQDYVLYWSIFIGMVAIMGIAGLIILWKIYKKLN
jgi:hypothetical protein